MRARRVKNVAGGPGGPPLRHEKARQRAYALVFAALGDETRLSIVRKLSDGQAQSIARLTEETKLTRQAVTKHLQALERARIVRSIRAGRETLFELVPQRIKEAGDYLDFVSEQWEDALSRLKAFVENE